MIDKIINDIDISIENGAYFAALALALTLPDICGKAEYPNSGSKHRYTSWYDKYVTDTGKSSNAYGEDMPYFSSEVAYQLRCNFLHQGTPNLDKSKVDEERCQIDKFILVIDDEEPSAWASKVTYEKGLNSKIKERELFVDVRAVCYSIKTAAKSYYDANKSLFNFFKCEIDDRREKREIIRKLREKSDRKGTENE